MKENNRNNTVLIVALVAAGCLVLLCVGMAIAVFLFGMSPMAIEEAPTQTTTLSTAQLEQCRKLMAIQPDVELEGEYYLYTPGFLDDSMECHLLAQANSLEDVFDTAVIDPSLTTDQEVSPGRFVRLKIETIEPGLYRIEGYWFQT